MGILDDAIREHLELKRKHGAESADLDRLEKEAFGPPSRPGEGGDEAERRAREAAEAETTLAPMPGAESGEEQPPAAGEHRIDWFEEFESEQQPAPGEAPEAGVEQSTAAGEEEQPAEAVGPAERALAEPPPGEEEPPEDAEPPEAAIFDQGDELEAAEDEELDLDLDLEIEGEGSAAPPAGEPAFEDDRGPEPPSEELDLTIGEDTADRAAEGGGGAATLDAGEEEPEGEDLLEETPDFLEDTPEGERLWFEQNPPQEFDFDDEDEDD
jgi:hypothetical protein